MPIQDQEVQRSPDIQSIKDMADRLLTPERNSPEIAGRKHNHWQAELDIFKTRNEDTFIGQFFNPFTNGARNVLSENGQTVQREWREDGLHVNQNQPFLTGSLNRIITNGPNEWRISPVMSLRFSRVSGSV